jgi:hypothetical protein
MPIGSPSRPKQGLIILATALMALLTALPSMAQEKRYIQDEVGKMALPVRVLEKSEPIMISQTHFVEFSNGSLFTTDGPRSILEIPLAGKKAVFHDLEGNVTPPSNFRYGAAISVQERQNQLNVYLRAGGGNE